MRLILILAATLLTHSVAQAGDRTFDCSIGDRHGHAEIKAMEVAGHPELLVFDIDLKTKLTYHATGNEGQPAHLGGWMVATIFNSQSFIASGRLNSSSDAVIINPLVVNIQGRLLSADTIEATLYDSRHELQLGYGIGFSCKLR